MQLRFRQAVIKDPGARKDHGEMILYTYIPLHDNKDFGALIGKIASPDAHA